MFHVVWYAHWFNEQNRRAQELNPARHRIENGSCEMDINKKSELVKTLIKNLELPEGSSLPDPTTSIGKDVAGSPEYVHAFEHQMNGDTVQAFQVYISRDGVTLRYEYSTSFILPFSGTNHIEKAVEDIGRFLKRGYDSRKEHVAERRQHCAPGLGDFGGE
jgi:hypothetical protein